MMHTDTPQFPTFTSATDDAVPTIIVPVNQSAVDTGLRVPVERVTVAELGRRQQHDAGQQAAADPATPLPNNVAVLQAMVLELRDTLAQRDHRIAELELAVDDFTRRQQRVPRNPWPADQPALFPEMQHDAEPPSDAAGNTSGSMT